MTEAMEYALSCSICMDLYNEPVLLPCMHSLCKDCLEKLRRPSGKVAKTVLCPQCRRSLDLKNVKKNFQLAAIVDVYREESARRQVLAKVSEERVTNSGHMQQQQQQNISAKQPWFLQKLQRIHNKPPELKPRKHRPPPPPPPTLPPRKYEQEETILQTVAKDAPIPLSTISIPQQMVSKASCTVAANGQPASPALPASPVEQTTAEPTWSPLNPTAPPVKQSTPSTPPSAVQCKSIEEANVVTEIPCMICETVPANPAIAHCSNCTMKFCGGCLSVYHPHPDTKTHDVKPTKVAQEEEKCVLCEKEKWSVFCMECNMLFCQTCQLGHHPSELNHWIHRDMRLQRSTSVITAPVEPTPPVQRPHSVATAMATPEAYATPNAEAEPAPKAPESALEAQATPVSKAQGPALAPHDKQCSSCTNSAAVRCLDCDENLCETCAQTKHQGDSKKTHTFIQLETIDEKKLAEIEQVVQRGLLNIMLLKEALMAEIAATLNCGK